MKLKFKVQPYQTTAVESVIDCFAGQVNSAGVSYRVDPGARQILEMTGFKNPDIRLTEARVLANIQAVQQRQNLPYSSIQRRRQR